MKSKFIIFLFLFKTLFFTANLAQKNTIDSLKNSNEELWYVDQAKPLPPIDKHNTEINGEPVESKKVDDHVNLDFLSGLGVLIKILMYLGLAALLIYIIYKVGNLSNVGGFRKKVKVMEITEETIIEDEETLQVISFENQIQQAENSQNYRLATRLYLLFLLQKLSLNNQIKYHLKKTNQDYITEIKNQNLVMPCKQCVAYYNRIWFGETLINEQTYLSIKNEFENLILQIK